MTFNTLLAFVFAFSLIKPNPQGFNVEGQLHPVKNPQFHADLSYQKEGKQVVEQEIFNEIYNIIDEAETFIIVDMFLFYDSMNMPEAFPRVASDLTMALINKKKDSPKVHIVVITDPFNSNYGHSEPEHFKTLKKYGIDVIESNTKKLRDSNPLYSSLWRTGIQWFGTKGPGFMPNISDPNAKKVTIRSYLALLNFKANHRKVVLSEKRGIISSANPHGLSGLHSNIAFSFDGSILNDVENSEAAVLKTSKQSWPDYIDDQVQHNTKQHDSSIQLLTEKKIKLQLLDSINRTKEGDGIDMAMFYLSQRHVIKALIKAANRGVDVRLILDANKDAFGRKKNGVPNRPVAAELIKRSKGKIKVKWYNTQGEQFHAKLIAIHYEKESELFGGSANLTRRNISDYNLESNVRLISTSSSKINKEVKTYFDRLWFNKGANFTLDYEAFADKSRLKTLQYWVQELTGLGTF